jgi:hypothetical protein
MKLQTEPSTASAFCGPSRGVTVRYSVRDDLFGLVADGLLTEHEALTRRPSGDQMQRLATLAARMGSPRGFAVDGDDVGHAIAQ